VSEFFFFFFFFFATQSNTDQMIAINSSSYLAIHSPSSFRYSEKEVAHLFKKSDQWNSLDVKTRKKVRVTVQFVKKYICRCFKKPNVKECVDAIRRNLDYSIAAAMRLAKGNSTTYRRGIAGEQARARAQKMLASKDALLRASYCEETERAGMSLAGVVKDLLGNWTSKPKPFITPQTKCKDRTCSVCKNKNGIFEGTLNSNSFHLRQWVKVRLECFENVEQKSKGKGTTKKVMKTSKQATADEVFKRLQEDLVKAGPHIFADRWKRRSTELFYQAMDDCDVSLSSDYTSTCTYISDETVTCGVPNHGYCEVFVAQVNKRRVGGSEPGEGVDIWETIVYYFMGKASGENKDNDHVAHKVHEDYVIKVSSHHRMITDVPTSTHTHHITLHAGPQEAPPTHQENPAQHRWLRGAILESLSPGQRL